MTPQHKDAAERALYEAGIICHVLLLVGRAQIGGEGTPIEGTAVEWLAERLKAAIERAEEAVEGLPLGAVS